MPASEALEGKEVEKLSGQRIVYPKHMTATDEGKALLAIWRRIKDDTDSNGPFSEYPDFYEWAIDNYYWLGSRLHRYEISQAYSPENCYFTPNGGEMRGLTKEQYGAANRWNRTVNVFRKACGLKLFDVYEEDSENDGLL